MKNKDAYIYVILLIVIATGCFIGGFWGGVITGSSTAFLILATIGKRMANKAAARLNKTIRDHIVKNS